MKTQRRTQLSDKNDKTKQASKNYNLWFALRVFFCVCIVPKSEVSVGRIFKTVLHLAHETCCSSDQHVFSLIVFRNGHHDVCRPLQCTPQHNSTCNDRREKPKKCSREKRYLCNANSIAWRHANPSAVYKDFRHSLLWRLFFFPIEVEPSTPATLFSFLLARWPIWKYLNF